MCNMHKKQYEHKESRTFLRMVCVPLLFIIWDSFSFQNIFGLSLGVRYCTQELFVRSNYCCTECRAEIRTQDPSFGRQSPSRLTPNSNKLRANTTHRKLYIQHIDIDYPLTPSYVCRLFGPSEDYLEQAETLNNEQCRYTKK